MLCFPCCVEDQPPPRRRPRIDRTQIGLPTNFQHTGHIGSGEVASGFDVHQVQTSMQSKGGYEHACSDVTNTPTGIDLTPHNKSNNVNGTPLAVGKTTTTSSSVATVNSEKNIPTSTGDDDEQAGKSDVNGTALTYPDAEEDTMPSVSADDVDIGVAVNGDDDGEVVSH